MKTIKSTSVRDVKPNERRSARKGKSEACHRAATASPRLIRNTFQRAVKEAVFILFAANQPWKHRVFNLHKTCYETTQKPEE